MNWLASFPSFGFSGLSSCSGKGVAVKLLDIRDLAVLACSFEFVFVRLMNSGFTHQSEVWQFSELLLPMQLVCFGNECLPRERMR